MSNMNRWDPWYRDATEQQQYGAEIAYLKAEEWLHDLPVEDWGCGYAWFRRYHKGPYVGIDGTKSRWCNVHADLTRYKSHGWSILLRGVLEHNYEWPKVLANAVSSFDKRLCIILFTPTGETKILAENVGGLGVPDIGFDVEDLTSAFTDDMTFELEQVHAENSGYNDVETIIRAERVGTNTS
jgi:hypothetical protein